MCRIDHIRFLFDYRFPRLPVLLRAFNPYGRPPDAGDAVHRRVTAEQDIACQQRDVVCCVSRRLQNLIRKIQCPEAIGIDWDQAIRVFFLDGGITVFTVTGQCEDLAGKPRKT